ncbi:hypothetical protein RUM43_010437 [Polyplax serrata]|uniref:Small ribosomal subunit protein bS6m n=1 Tax=Polyplax serrata TaxID=468196 RepID=A0AAN8S4V6_POLSC
MPTYEMVLLLKKMNQAGLKSVLTRNAKYILESGGTLRRMENLGFQRTPFAVKIAGQPRENNAHYFLLHYDAGITENSEILDKCRRDMDVLRSTSHVEHLTPGGDLDEQPKPECTIWEDMLPAPERPSVKVLLEQNEERQKNFAKRRFKYNSGLHYDPF